MFRRGWAVFCIAVVDIVQCRSVKIRFELTSYNITNIYQSIEVGHIISNNSDLRVHFRVEQLSDVRLLWVFVDQVLAEFLEIDLIVTIKIALIQ